MLYKTSRNKKTLAGIFLALLAIQSINPNPAGAQVTVLQGSAIRSRIASPSLIRQTPAPDFSATQSLHATSTAITPPSANSVSPRHVVEHPVTYAGPKSYHQPSFWQRHPKIKGVTIGAGIGAGAGALTGLITHKGIFRGAAIGAGAGAGVGLIRTSDTLKRHPYVRNIATGAVTGLGLGWAGSRGRHTGRNVGITTGIGAALGLGTTLFQRR